MNNQNIELSASFAESVTRARLKAEELAEVHAEAVEKLETIRDRISRIEAERAKLVSSRKPGEPVDDATAGKVYLLNQDIETLRPLLVEVSNEEAAVSANLAGAQGRLAAAEQNWTRHQNEVLLANLKQRVAQTEQLLFGILNDVAQVGAKLGKPHLVQSWSPSNDLKNLVSFGALPGRGFR
ncbi:hypothetical protein [Methylocaldum sp.]|uniref:hypothetical protein n=1 Tax=Methylocaldum sp. TaxID=1969727 RepID=UPI002D2EB255|nr:hypothetical protein [Methylocaldum sp.]HYE36129.1 hypothetical protein [Methylocaldum sp.]